MNDNVVLEPQSRSWGGKWTIQKLDAFEKYVSAYLTIMNKNRDNYNWELIYFDGFAGSGSKKDDILNELLLDLFSEEEFEDLDVYKGSSERILQISQRGFDYYYFIDNDKNANKGLKQKLKPYTKKNAEKKIVFRSNDANNEIIKLSQAMHRDKKYKSLVFLDPFGMQINWESIEKLKDTNTDLWILIPTGVIVNRLLDRKAKLTHLNKLTSFFGLSEDEIRKKFYEVKKANTLFGEVTVIEKVKEPIGKIAELYVGKLKEIFNFVTSEPLVLYNKKNVPIYHFAFASNNQVAQKIAGQIIQTSKK